MISPSFGDARAHRRAAFVAGGLFCISMSVSAMAGLGACGTEDRSARTTCFKGEVEKGGCTDENQCRLRAKSA
jgi:hypothetical protein